MEKGHGRIEQRTLEAFGVTPMEMSWPGAAQVCRLVRERTRGEKTSIETVFLVTSLDSEKFDPEKILGFSRAHWGIENRLHCVRDVTFREDACRVRTGSLPQLLAAFRNTAITSFHRLGFTSMIEGLEHFAEHRRQAIRFIREGKTK